MVNTTLILKAWEFMNSTRWNNLSLKYQRFTQSGCKDIEIIPDYGKDFLYNWPNFFAKIDTVYYLYYNFFQKIFPENMQLTLKTIMKAIIFEIYFDYQ